MKKALLLCLSILSIGNLIGQEICDNGIDDDTDGLIDLNDPDCDCSGFAISGSGTNLITNPSFEDLLCCPTGFAQLTCADQWLQSTSVVAGHADYWHTCGMSTSGLLTDATLPAPDGLGWAGFLSGYNASATHNEYLSKCLGTPLVGGTTYTLTGWMARGDGSPDLNITVYGTTTCADLPWGAAVCPDGIGSWMELGTSWTNFPTYGDWYPFTVIFTPPVDIAAVALGGNCITSPVPATDTYNYYYVDALDLNDGGGGGGFTGMSISESVGGCTASSLIASVGASGGTLQWYLDGIALVGETSTTLDITGTGPGDYSAVYFLPDSSVPDSCHQVDHTVNAGTVIADFNWVDTCFTDPTAFSDQTIFGSGAITSWLWDMGDGGAFSFLQNPSHTFSGPGTFNVTLTVTHDSGCDDVISQTVEITDCYAGLEASSLAHINLYPNPANGSFSVKLGEPKEKVNIIVRDVLGRTIYQDTFSDLSLISDVPIKSKGVYVVTIRIDDKTEGSLRLVNE
jgi:hypothetical protein